MSYTKRQFVNAAFSEIGFAAYQYEIQPELLEEAMRRMDAMLATWNARGIRIGYPIPDSPENSSLDTETQVPDRANEAIYTNLAIRIAPIVGKSITQEMRITAREAYMAMLQHSVNPLEKQMPWHLPLGAGHKGWRNGGYGEFARETDCLESGEDGCIDFE